MLVSTIARLSAINSMNNAAYNSMMCSQNIMNCAFRGDMNFEKAHNIEKQLEINMLKNSLIYNFSSKQLEQQKKSSLNYLV